jgi:hypothetical protein
MTEKYVYLLLVDVEGEPFLVETPHPTDVGDLVEFREGTTRCIGKVVAKSFEDIESDSYAMLSMLKPMFQAEKIWSTSWEARNPGQ